MARLIAGDPAAPTLALVAAVALEEVVTAYAGPDRTSIKWPNDLLLRTPAQAGVQIGGGAEPRLALGYGKLGGILLERSGDAVVIGFGVNLADHPEEIDRPATSLSAAGVDAPNPANFLTDLADGFAQWFGRWRGQGLATIRQRWLERAHPIGTALSVRGAEGAPIDGLFDGLDETGALRLRLADGSVHVMHAGDVFLI